MLLALLDAATLGNVPNLDKLKEFGRLDIFETTSFEEIIPRVKEYDIIITNKVPIDKEVMEQSPKLKLICKAATGMNDVDLEYAGEKGIAVKNVTDYSTHSVAQVTFTLILYLLNKPAYYDQYVHSGQYAKSKIFTHLGREFWELHGKKLGIIGLGTIGKRVAQIGEAFGMEVLYYSSSGKNNNTQYQRLELNQLLAEVDVVTIHAPLTDQTKNLINYHKIKLMKSTALLINAGRGGIIHEDDLVKALNENLIHGAGLDVLETEPIKKDHPLLSIKDQEKLIITPHIAWSSIESRTLLVDRIYENIKYFLKA